jgi:yeast amino acid transporter
MTGSVSATGCVRLPPTHSGSQVNTTAASKIEGAPFAEYIEEGNLGRFMGFIACLTAASFTIAGPDYVAITAGEAKLPRKTLPRAFRGVSLRLTTFFVLGSLCVGILVPYNDPDLLGALSEARAGAGSSPYVIAMKKLKIPVLPHIVNALLLTTVFSAGNGYVYTSSRMLFGLALEGKAPRRLLYCTKNGIPIYCVAISLTGALLCTSLHLERAMPMLTSALSSVPATFE